MIMMTMMIMTVIIFTKKKKAYEKRANLYLKDTHQIICIVYKIGIYFLTLTTRGIFLARLHNFGKASNRQSVATQ